MRENQRGQRPSSRARRRLPVQIAETMLVRLTRVLAAKAPDTGLRRAAARGFAWTGAQALVNRALSLIGFVVIARLLSPKEYGVVALANVFSALFAVLSASGYSQVLVQRAHIDKEDLDTVFWIGLGMSAVLTLLLVGAAWPLAAAFHEPKLRPVLQVLATSFVFIAAGGTHQAVLQRRLDWRSLAFRTMLASGVATVVGVAFAFLGFGVWALVVQSVLAVAVGSATVMVRSGYRPSLYVSKARFLDLFADSRNFLGNSLLRFLNIRTDDFLIGTVLGSTALGIYAVAYRILLVMIDVLNISVRRVAFPVFARVQDDRERLLRAYVSANRMSSATATPAFLLVLAVAPEAVHVLFGTRWDASVPVMQILCLFGMLQAVSQFNGALLSSIGRIRFVFRFGLLNTGVQVAAFVIAAPFGIRWVAASYVIRAYVLAPVGFIVAARELNTTARKTLSGFLPGFVSSGVMVASVIAVRHLLGHGLPEPVRLVVLLAVALPVYLATLRLSGRLLYDELVHYVRGVVSRRVEGPASSTGR